jgi:hypothetical protein
MFNVFLSAYNPKGAIAVEWYLWTKEIKRTVGEVIALKTLLTRLNLFLKRVNAETWLCLERAIRLYRQHVCDLTFDENHDYYLDLENGLAEAIVLRDLQHTRFLRCFVPNGKYALYILRFIVLQFTFQFFSVPVPVFAPIPQVPLPPVPIPLPLQQHIEDDLFVYDDELIRAMTDIEIAAVLQEERDVQNAAKIVRGDVPEPRVNAANDHVANVQEEVQQQEMWYHRLAAAETREAEFGAKESAGTLTVRCQHCFALHFTKETRDVDGFGSCCCHGQVPRPRQPRYPPLLQALLKGEDPLSESFMDKIRVYHSAFTMGSFCGSKKLEQVSTGGGDYFFA